jgi:CRP/FNR family transcriptional regulator
MKLYLTRQEIGDYLGLTLETVSRAFSKLRDMRVIAVLGSDSVAIIDEERLRELTRR